MKHGKLFTLSLVLLTTCGMIFTGCSESSTNNGKEESVNETNKEQIVDDLQDEKEEDTVNKYEYSDDSSINEIANEVIELGDDQEIESSEWVDSDKSCFRVGIKRKEEVEGEYSHTADYFFIKDEDIKQIKVDYPSKASSFNEDRHVFDACDFKAEYVDVTFDGHNDIVISLGHDGAAGTLVHCAYIYDEGEFNYVKSFEEIPNYEIDEAKQCIVGSFKDDIYEYEFKDKEFVQK